MSRPRGPFCSLCGHEYRSKDGALDVVALGEWREHGAPVRCTYCGVASPPVAQKPFDELSKSAIEKFLLCPARWGFNYLEHKREPSSKYAKFGIIGHEMGERWLKFGELPKINSLDPKSVETKAATSLLGGIPHMPPPTLPGLLAECEFHFAFEGVHYMGYKDAWAPLPSPPQENHTLVGDWKFCGDVNGQHNLTNDTIADDVQSIIYGFDDVRRGATHVWANWCYMPRGERGAKPVRACMPAADIAARMAKINETGKKMLHLLTVRPPVSTLEASGGDACRAYGMSCPHLSYCHVTFENQLPEIGGSQMAQLPPGMVANGAPPSPLDALLGGMAAPPAAPPPFAVAAPVAPAQVNPPPPPQFNPAAMYRVLWQGVPYDISGDKVPGALLGGATLLEAPAAPPAPLPVAVVVAPAPIAAPPVPSTTGPAPGAPGRAPGRGRPRKAAAQGTAADAGAPEGDFEVFLARVRDAITEYLGG